MNTPSAHFRSLPIAERIQLVTEIWDSIATETPGPALPFSEGDFAEWNRRLAAYRADPASGVPWAQVQRTMLGDDES